MEAYSLDLRERILRTCDQSGLIRVEIADDLGVSRSLKTQGEIENAISEGMGRFEQEYMSRGPKYVYAHLIDELVVVRLCCVF
ncbi:MAG: Na-translocating system protein MpsC family protein [Tepidisphaeraceae bacterium]|jgi:hypothetical protein